MVLDTVRKPLLGLATTSSSLLVSLQEMTEVLQCGAAIIALIVGLGTMRLTYIRIKKIKKELKDEISHIK